MMLFMMQVKILLLEWFCYRLKDLLQKMECILFVQEEIKKLADTIGMPLFQQIGQNDTPVVGRPPDQKVLRRRPPGARQPVGVRLEPARGHHHRFRREHHPLTADRRLHPPATQRRQE